MYTKCLRPQAAALQEFIIIVLVGDVSGRYIDTMRNGARSNETTLYEEPPQNYETPRQRNIYSTLSDDIQVFPPAAAYEVPLGTLQVKHSLSSPSVRI